LLAAGCRDEMTRLNNVWQGSCAARFPLLAATASAARAQDEGWPMLAWLSAGIGGSSLGFVAGSANATVQIHSLVVSLRATDNTQQLFGGDELSDGVPIEAQAFVGGANVAIGMYLYANINAQRSFAGATLALQIGQLR
jgi:hypothetical protein